MDSFSPDLMRKTRTAIKVDLSPNCVEKALPIFKEVTNAFIEEAEDCIEPSWKLQCESEVFVEIYNEFQRVKVNILAELLAISLTEVLVPTSEGVISVTLSCQLALIALSENKNVRPEFKQAIKAKIMKRFSSETEKEYSVGFGLSNSIYLPDFGASD